MRETTFTYVMMILNFVGAVIFCVSIYNMIGLLHLYSWGEFVFDVSFATGFVALFLLNMLYIYRT